jgi:hypothetical protein
MLDERTRARARSWGAVALILQLWLTLAFAGACVRGLYAFFQQHGVRIFVERMSQLRPAAFKHPFNSAYVIAYLLAVVIVLGRMWQVGLRSARRPAASDAGGRGDEPDQARMTRRTTAQ